MGWRVLLHRLLFSSLYSLYKVTFLYTFLVFAHQTMVVLFFFSLFETSAGFTESFQNLSNETFWTRRLFVKKGRGVLILERLHICSFCFLLCPLIRGNLYSPEYVNTEWSPLWLMNLIQAQIVNCSNFGIDLSYWIVPSCSNAYLSMVQWPLSLWEETK